MVKDEVLPDNLRCTRTDGRRWRCKKRVMDDKKLCELHYSKILMRKKRVSSKISMEEDGTVPDQLRCNRTDGRKWRCSERVMDNKKVCETHYRIIVSKKKGSSQKNSIKEEEALPQCTKTGGQQWRCDRKVKEDEKLCEIFPRKISSSEKEFSLKLSMIKEEPLPDHLRCGRTDGRKWRCNRRALDNKSLCEIHHLQGRHRQDKKKVPDSLKIQRRSRKPLDKPWDVQNFESKANRNYKLANSVKRRRWMRVSEALDEALKKMKLKKGDLQLDLIRMFLQRQVERRYKRDSEEANCKEDLMRDLPNGLMAISPSLSPLQFDNAGPSCEVKIGIDSGSFMRRCFRSKNIEPLPIGPLKVVPFPKKGKKLRRVRRKNCHWCLKRGFRTLIKCSSCQKEYFCVDCIKERYSNTQEEIRVACPVCRGSCSCKVCSANQSKTFESKDHKAGSQEAAREDNND